MTLIFETIWPHATAAERERFAGKVFFRDAESCWIWTGGIESSGGYSRFRQQDSSVIAGHRWSLRAQLGALSGPVVRHVCDVRVCVRPGCLRAGTQAQHIADTVRRGHQMTIARIGPTTWPTLAYSLRSAAQDGDTDRLDELLARPVQLDLFPVPPSTPDQPIVT